MPKNAVDINIKSERLPILGLMDILKRDFFVSELFSYSELFGCFYLNNSFPNLC